jgi:hypothetical protein
MPFALCVAVGETAAARAQHLLAAADVFHNKKPISRNRAPFSFSEDFKEAKCFAK